MKVEYAYFADLKNQKLVAKATYLEQSVKEDQIVNLHRSPILKIW